MSTVLKHGLSERESAAAILFLMYSDFAFVGGHLEPIFQQPRDFQSQKGLVKKRKCYIIQLTILTLFAVFFFHDANI